MKQLLLLSIILAAFSMPAHADTIDVKAVANDVLATSGLFSDKPAGTTGGVVLSDLDIEKKLSNGISTAIYGLDNLIPATTPETNWVSIDLGFGDDTVITGPGADLAIFSLWSGNSNSYSFGLEAYDNNDNLLSSFDYGPLTVGGPNPTSSIFPSASGVITTSINLLDGSDIALDNNIEIAYIRMFIGNDYDGDGDGANAYSNFSLVGAAYTQMTVVPLPFPAVLFSSGLLLLGWVGRRKTS